MDATLQRRKANAALLTDPLLHRFLRPARQAGSADREDHDCLRLRAIRPPGGTIPYKWPDGLPLSVLINCDCSSIKVHKQKESLSEKRIRLESGGGGCSLLQMISSRYTLKVIRNLAVAIVALGSTPVYSTVNLSVIQDGTDVIVSYDGSWDSWGTAASNTFDLQRVNEAQVFNIVENIDRYVPPETFTLTSGTWKNNSNFSATTVAGDRFGFATGDAGIATLYAPASYTAESTITGSLTFTDQDLLSMGFTPNSSGTFSGGGNTVDFTVGAIPEPNSYGVLLGAAGLATAIFFRRRRRSSAP